MPISKASGQAVAVAAKGDLVVGSATNDAAVLGVGSADQVLTVDSSTATGLKWATPSAGGMTLISTTTLSGASVTLSSIPQTYNHLQLVIRQYLPAVASSLRCRINADTNTRYRFSFFGGTDLDGTTALTFNQDNIQIVAANNTSTSQSSAVINFYDYTNTSTWKIGQSMAISTDSTTSTSQRLYANMFSYNQTGAISSLVFYQSGGNLTSGTLLLYGVK